MMTCAHLRELLSAYLDAQSPPGPAAEVAAHLQACPRCREEMESLRWAGRLLASLPAPRLEFDLAPAVVARASIPRWRERWRAGRDFLAPRQGFYLRQFARAAAIVALFMLAATVRGRGPSDLLISWPGRVAGAAGTGMAHLTAGLAQAQVFLGGGLPDIPSDRGAASLKERRSPPAQPSRLPCAPAIASKGEEVGSHVLA